MFFVCFAGLLSGLCRLLISTVPVTFSDTFICCHIVPSVKMNQHLSGCFLNEQRIIVRHWIKATSSYLMKHKDLQLHEHILMCWPWSTWESSQSPCTYSFLSAEQLLLHPAWSVKQEETDEWWLSASDPYRPVLAIIEFLSHYQSTKDNKRQSWRATCCVTFCPFTFSIWPKVWRLFPEVQLPDGGGLHSTQNKQGLIAGEKRSTGHSAVIIRKMQFGPHVHLEHTSCFLIKVHSFLQVYRLYQSWRREGVDYRKVNR